MRLHVLPEVALALRHGAPVVALESTVIAHGGMPYPKNLHAAQAIEAAVRQGGAVPATIAVIHGDLRVGLDEETLKELARAGPSTSKLSSRDLPWAVATRSNGATTVAATVEIARRAGVTVFATGGLGGVHYGAEETGDVSADIAQLAHRADGMCVVCAGVKSILDIPKTLERFETEGIPVLALGQDHFPAFYRRSSGVSVRRVNSPKEVAQHMQATKALRLGSAVVLGVPVPREAEADADTIERAISRALAEADQEKIGGSQVTPFILGRVAKETGGKSIATNVALLVNNASVASQVAHEFSTISAAAASRPQRPPEVAPHRNPMVLVMGGAAVDVVAHPFQRAETRHITTGVSHPGQVQQLWGGVARNVAEALSLLGVSVEFVSRVGRDDMGRGLIRRLRQTGVSTRWVDRIDTLPTPTFVAIHGMDKNLVAGVADFRALEMGWSGVIRSVRDATMWETLRFLVLDANLPLVSLEAMCERARAMQIPVWLEPTSPAKAISVAPLIPKVIWASPNESELSVMADALRRDGLVPPGLDDVATVLHFGTPQLRLLVTRGSSGVTLHRKDVPAVRFEAEKVVGPVVNTSGAGDSLVAGVVAGLMQGLEEEAAIRCGLKAATVSIACLSAVSPRLSPASIGLVPSKVSKL